MSRSYLSTKSRKYSRCDLFLSKERLLFLAGVHLGGCLTVNLIEPPSTPPSPSSGPCEAWKNPTPIVTISIKKLNEISGIVSSRNNPGILWIHEDSGNSAQVFAINTRGDLIGTINIEGLAAKDWEDIAIGPCGTEDCLYVADTGDNLAVRQDASVFRLVEPTIKGKEPFRLTVTPEQFLLQYPDGPQDVEALAITPQGFPVLFSKRLDGTSRVFTFPVLDSTQVVELLDLGTINIGGAKGLPAAVTAADMLPDGSRFLLRAYLLALEFRLPQGDLTRLDEAKVVSVPAALELQGEAIAYENNQGGFWQVSEGQSPTLFYASCDEP
jgi:hypothetical protein